MINRSLRFTNKSILYSFNSGEVSAKNVITISFANITKKLIICNSMDGQLLLTKLSPNHLYKRKK